MEQWWKKIIGLIPVKSNSVQENWRSEEEEPATKHRQVEGPEAEGAFCVSKDVSAS